jgi:phospholipid/cholesterol/gamma-HCH transport system permease protein
MKTTDRSIQERLTLSAPALTHHAETLALAMKLFYESIFILFRQLFRLERSRKREVIAQCVAIGIESLPIIVVSTAFAGVVITKEIAWHMNEALHTVSMAPGFTGQFILRELAVAIPTFLIISKVGASMTAEVGSMKITDQIDALHLLQINPVSYLVYPRWIASMISLICLTLIAAAVTLGCAITVAVSQFNFNALEYFNVMRHFIGMKDILCAIAKSLTYGAMIPFVACAYGFRCAGGAQGVGSATTNAVVVSTTLVIIFDFVLTYLFSLVY